MVKKLRSNFNKGSMPWAMRRANWRALGLNDADLEKPKIAIVNSSSTLAVCFSHLDEVAKKLKESIYAGGGVPMEVRTSAPTDFITATGHAGGYILAGRDLIANDIEIAVEGAMLDGMICLGSCDKTIPGQLMAAARLNIPTLILCCGYQPSGNYRGEHFDIEDLFINVGHYAAGKITIEDLTEMTENAIMGPGVCPGIGTANSMHCAAEALGMSLPGSTPVAANTPNMWQAVREAGERIVKMVWNDIKPRDILTPEAFANAAMTILAISGSINTIKHLQIVATEAECDVNLFKIFEEYADKVPLLTAIRPNGKYLIEDFEQAGGTRALMKQIESLIHKDAKIITEQTISEIIETVKVANNDVIRPMDRAFSWRPSIVMVSGTMLEFGIVKLAVDDDRPLHFLGPAIVYETRETAIEGIKKGEVKPGMVLILRGLGLKGNPGMGLCSNVVFALDGAGLTGKVAMITDGSVSGLCNKTLLICEAIPEAAEGGPLALVKTGDTIMIDVKEKRVDIDVSEEELNVRRASLPPFPPTENKGWLNIYQRLVGHLHKGAGLIG